MLSSPHAAYLSHEYRLSRGNVVPPKYFARPPNQVVYRLTGGVVHTQLKVLNAVVGAHPVSVMHRFSGQEVSSQVLRHNEAVL
jgi:hypothetical protein